MLYQYYYNSEKGHGQLEMQMKVFYRFFLRLKIGKRTKILTSVIK